MNDAWHYWSSDGIGLLEFLDWCEDLHMDPVLALYAGLFTAPAAREARSGPATAACAIFFEEGDVDVVIGRVSTEGDDRPADVRHRTGLP
jgi:alpha-L-arabinofuranosidase